MWIRGSLVFVGCLSITIAMWVVSPTIETITTAQSLAELVGGLALVGFAWVFLISTRWSAIDRLFHGQDKAYVAHKWFAVISVVLAFTHMVVIHRATSARFAEVTILNHLGRPSLILFVFLTTVALIGKKLKYEPWKMIHKLMVIPYVIGLAHYYGSTSFGIGFQTGLSAWMNLVNLVGVGSIIYTILLYLHLGFRYRYAVSEVKLLTPSTIEITGVAIGKPLSYRPGQFAFVRFPCHHFNSHPFTISGANSKVDEIQFTIKALGDHTRALIKAVKTSDLFIVAGPYGQFDYTRGLKDQIWIAGGVGVTPFRSFLDSGVPHDFNVDFFYAHPGTDESMYLGELGKLATSNVRIHFSDDKLNGFLTADKIATNVESRLVDVFFCGPPLMRRSLQAGMKTAGISVHRFHYERFGFGR